jgi:hypothetical protein
MNWYVKLSKNSEVKKYAYSNYQSGSECATKCASRSGSG